MKNSDETVFPVAIVADAPDTGEAAHVSLSGENGDTSTSCKSTLLTPPSGRPEDRGHPERKRRASNDSADVRIDLRVYIELTKHLRKKHAICVLN